MNIKRDFLKNLINLQEKFRFLSKTLNVIHTYTNIGTNCGYVKWQWNIIPNFEIKNKNDYKIRVIFPVPVQ